MNKATVHIKGMHCRSCEILIEDELLKISGVTEVKVNEKKGMHTYVMKEILIIKKLKRRCAMRGMN